MMSDVDLARMQLHHLAEATQHARPGRYSIRLRFRSAEDALRLIGTEPVPASLMPDPITRIAGIPIDIDPSILDPNHFEIDLIP